MAKIMDDSRDDKFDPRSCLKATENHSTRNNLLNTIIRPIYTKKIIGSVLVRHERKQKAMFNLFDTKSPTIDYRTQCDHIVSRTAVLIVGKSQWRRFCCNGMQGVKGGSNPQPFVDINFRCFLAQWTMVDERSRFVYDKQVQERHIAGILS